MTHANEMNNPKVEKYKVVEVKPGVYFRFNSVGNGELTEDVTKAKRYDEVSGDGAEGCARKWFGKVKTLRVTSEVE